MRYLSQLEIITLNHRTVKSHGGNFVPPNNLLRDGALEYVVDIVQQEVFGERVFSSIAEIASAYMFYIVNGHVFQDGNKRTGLAAAIIFLQMNSYSLKDELDFIQSEELKSVPVNTSERDILFQLTMELAAGELTLEELKQWFAHNTVNR